jgi:hypothetical protein
VLRTFAVRGNWFSALAIALAILFCRSALAFEGEGDDGDRDWRPVYQRHAFERDDHGKHRKSFRHSSRFAAPQVNSAWFQRPYPYHLDYYKMRYGGSYAPYFGNLYGPPQVVTAPPYYGPYYGEFVNGGGYGMGNGPYPLNYEQIPGQPPTMPGEVVEEVAQ